LERSAIVNHLPAASERLEAELVQALRELPAASAGVDFQSTVLARASAAATRRKVRRRRTLSLAAALIAVVAGLGAWRLESSRERAVRRAVLVEEHRRLLGELDELRALAAGRSLLSLGGDASTVIVLDLATVPSGASTASTPGVDSSTLSTRSPG
jgi:hypothetical protein